MSQQPIPVSPSSHPMKWHKFLIYFALWLSALACLSNALMYFTGSHYGGYAQDVYLVFSGMKVLDVLCGIACLALCAYTVMTRFALAAYRAKGPKMLTNIYLLNLLISLAYALLGSMITGLSFMDLLGTFLGYVIGSAVMIFVNRTYYNNRAELFTN